MFLWRKRTPRPTQADIDQMVQQTGLALQNAEKNKQKDPVYFKTWDDIAFKCARLMALREAHPAVEPTDYERGLYHEIMRDIQLASRT